MKAQGIQIDSEVADYIAVLAEAVAHLEASGHYQEEGLREVIDCYIRYLLKTAEEAEEVACGA